VSSSRESETALHVGRVVDPSVREDGEAEPDVQLAVAAVPSASLPAEEAHSGIGNDPSDAQHELESDRPTFGADLEYGSPNNGRLSSLQGDSSGATQRNLELELVGTQPMRLDVNPDVAGVPSKHRLSPGWTAVFASLLGLCTVATFIAITIQLDRHPAKVAEIRNKEPVTASPSAVPSPPLDKRPPRIKVQGPWRIRDAEKDTTARIIEGKVGLDPLVKSVEKSGVPLKQFYRVIAAFAKVRPLSNCAKTDRYALLLDRNSNRIKAFEYLTNPEEVFQAREGDDGLLTVQKLDLQLKQQRVTSAFVVGDEGLEAAVIAGGLEKPIISTMREALSGHAALEELERGTRVRVAAQELTVLGDFARYVGIEALDIDYPGSERKRERIYYFNGPESRGYFDAAGRAPYSGGWRKPIPSAPITSKFNPHRFHPILKRIMPHEGIDFGAQMGTPVGASSYGTVTFVGFAGPTGNFVRLSHPGDIETGYAHLSRFAEGLKVGDKVKRMQLVGYVGSTGRSTGPHLHFSAKRAGKFFDPETLNLDGLRTLAQRERSQFEQTKTECDKLLDAIAMPAPLASPPQSTAPKATETAEGDEAEAIPSAAGTGSAATPPASAHGDNAPHGNAVYLTDDELKKTPSGSDDGEVSE
jgi:murein DD-endopeptidase MepM/ murein hydrolase activator NlpD